jgi:hypothetical protein
LLLTSPAVGAFTEETLLSHVIFINLTENMVCYDVRYQKNVPLPAIEIPCKQIRIAGKYNRVG